MPKVAHNWTDAWCIGPVQAHFRHVYMVIISDIGEQASHFHLDLLAIRPLISVSIVLVFLLKLFRRML